MWRNIFAYEDEDEDWRSALDAFPNHVPRFAVRGTVEDTTKEAIEFTKRHCTTGSNPEHKHLQHSISTLVDWSQIERYMLPKLLEYDQRWPSRSWKSVDLSQNRYVSDQSSGNVRSGAPSSVLRQYISSRLKLAIHRQLSVDSRVNTLRYLFQHMKCGIFVMIRNRQVAMFAPFVNKDYRNSWSDVLQVESGDGTVKTYSREKRSYYRFPQEESLLDKSQWWANGNIICNTYGQEEGSESIQYWGDHFLLCLKDMFAELCRCRDVPDCDFFINKRDYPQLKFNNDPLFPGGPQPVEPYGFIFDRDDRDPAQDVPLSREKYQSYAPILSFYSSSRFADIPIPPTEDWESATGEIFPGSFIHTRDENGELKVSTPRDFFAKRDTQHRLRWEQKKPTAFFRGTATGGGTTADTNQRLHLAQLSHDWSKDPALNGSQEGHYPYLDAKITGWNKRDKKIHSHAAMTYVKHKDFPFYGGSNNFVKIYQQYEYKYLIYAEGHCAACRYGFMMTLGSVILKVDSSCVADQMWYFPLLRPYVDHVPVKQDLSNLREQLEWCHTHDEECRKIVENAALLYERYISRDGILDYLQCMTVEIARRWMPVSVGSVESAPMEEAFPLQQVNQLLAISGMKRDRDEDGCIQGPGHVFEDCAYCSAKRKRQVAAAAGSVPSSGQAQWGGVKAAAESAPELRKKFRQNMLNRSSTKPSTGSS